MADGINPGNPQAPPQSPSPGMSVNVSPPTSPLGSTAPPDYGPEPKSSILQTHKINLMYIGIAAVILIIIAGVLVFVVPNLKPATTTTLPTTSTSQSGAQYLSSCQVIASPGQYYVSGPLRTSNTNGPCITVNANNVDIVCNGEPILGSGPYVGVPPFSYGIYASNRSNVSVSSCPIGNFSFGVYFSAITGFAIQQSNLSHDYMSGLYLGGSQNGHVSQNTFANDSSPNGAVLIANGTTNVTIQNNTLENNAQYGFNLQSKGLRFYNNKVSLSQTSFVCSGSAGFPQSSVASGNSCYNNTGCGFLECNGTNTATNLASLILGYSVSSCGSITNPGTYNLQQSLNIFDYVDPKLKASSTAACLTIKSSNVNLNCNGNSISNASTAITATGVSNLTISNCTVVNASTGLSFYSVNGGRVLKMHVSKSSTGMWLEDSGGLYVANSSANGGSTGLYLANTTASIFEYINTSNNRFGLSLSDSLGNNFNFGTAVNNARFDVYTDNASSASGVDIMSKYNCGVTDAAWATCTTYVRANFSVTPVTGCEAVVRAGSYELQDSVITAPSDCINIKTNNVLFNCNNETISSSINVQGPAILVNRDKNVTLENCRVEYFNTGVTVSNSTYITLNHVYDNLTNSYGITLYNDTHTLMENGSASGTRNASIYLNDVRYSTIENNNMTNATGNGAAQMLIVNSSGNRITGNFGDIGYYGMEMNGSTYNNIVVGNGFAATSQDDYVCNGQTGNLGAQLGGSNNGATKLGCGWLAAKPAGSLPLGCETLTGPQYITLSSDFVYPSNSTCFLMSGPSSSSTIDCDGHTVLAPNGGTFVWVLNGSNVTVKDCKLKGFTVPLIESEGHNVNYVNITILINTTNKNSSAASVGMYSSDGAKLERLNITTPYIGIYADNVVSSLIDHVDVNALNTAFALYDFNNSAIYNSSSASSSGTGVLLANSIGNLFENDNFFGITSGLWCLYKSTNGNSDFGGNSCSLNNGCSWISSSAPNCPT